jgi:ABC-type phosphate/phosphonate transport system substrate-binding protein
LPNIFLRWFQFFFVVLILSFCFPFSGLSVEKVSIGILAHRGNEATLNRWQPLAEYLNREIPGHFFQIIPLDFDEIFEAVDRKQVDFILVNPGMYVELEYNHAVRPIATMRNQRQAGGTSLFSGLIIVLKSRDAKPVLP